MTIVSDSNRSWSSTEEQQLRELWTAGHSTREIAAQLGRTWKAVKLKRFKLGLTPRASNPFAPASERPARRAPKLEEVLLQEARDHLYNRDHHLLHKDKVMEARRIAFEERFLELLSERLPLWLPPNPPLSRHPVPKTDRHAVLLLGDTHIGQQFRAEETDGYSAYSPLIFVSRLRYLEKRIRTLMADFSASSLHVLFLGDLVHGMLNHAAEREETLLVVDQFSLAMHCFSQFLISLKRDFAKITCHGVVGNHGRWPHQRKPPSVGRYSNLDGLVLRALEAMLQNHGVTFDLQPRGRQIVEIGGTHIHLMHGDEVRGGGEVPYRGMLREAAANAFRAAAQGLPPADLFVMGDKHRSMNLPVGESQYMVNGAFATGDQFGQNFCPVRASQTLFWVEPEQGKVAQADIALDLAPLLAPEQCGVPAFLQRFLFQ